MIIPVYENKKFQHNEIIATVRFTDNLTEPDVAAYINENGLLGLSREKEGKLKGKLIYQYYNPFFPSYSFAYELSEEEAYKLCVEKHRMDLVRKLQITPRWED